MCVGTGACVGIIGAGNCQTVSWQVRESVTWSVRSIVQSAQSVSQTLRAHRRVHGHYVVIVDTHFPPTQAARTKRASRSTGITRPVVSLHRLRRVARQHLFRICSPRLERARSHAARHAPASSAESASGLARAAASSGASASGDSARHGRVESRSATTCSQRRAAVAARGIARPSPERSRQPQHRAQPH